LTLAADRPLTFPVARFGRMQRSCPPHTLGYSACAELLPSSPPCLRRRKPETASNQRRRLLSRIREEARVVSKRLLLCLGATLFRAAACPPKSLALRPGEAPTPLAASRAIDSVVSSMTALPPVDHALSSVSLRRTTRDHIPMSTEACQTNLCCPPSLVVKDTYPCPALLRHKPRLTAQPVAGESFVYGPRTRLRWVVR